MSKNKVIRIIGAICIGLGIGLCVGVATGNVLSGCLIGFGIGLCFSVALGCFKNEE